MICDRYMNVGINDINDMIWRAMKIWMPSDQSLKMGCRTGSPRSPDRCWLPARPKAFRLRVLNLNMYSIILVIHPGILGDGRYIQIQVIQNSSFPFGLPLFSNVLALRIPAYLFNIQDAANCCLLWLLVIMAMQARIVGGWSVKNH